MRVARPDSDILGEVIVPFETLWSAYECTLDHFCIGADLMPREIKGPDVRYDFEEPGDEHPDSSV
jgi:hypothetical protein